MLDKKILETRAAELRKYIDWCGSRMDAAHRLGIDLSTLDSWVTGRRGLKPEMALKIEQESNGRFKKEKLIFGNA